MSEAENIFKRVLHKALEETASAAVEAGGSRLLMRVLPYVLANPAASIVAAVTKELMAALLDQSSLMEKKIDKLMEVPFRAGARELLDCLETRPANETEKIFWIEKLNQASSHLDEAYASADAPGKKLLVRAMQTSVVALIPGGTSFFNKYIQEFRDVSRDMKTRSAQLRKEADEILEKRLRAGETIFIFPRGELEKRGLK